MTLDSSVSILGVPQGTILDPQQNDYKKKKKTRSTNFIQFRNNSTKHVSGFNCTKSTWSRDLHRDVCISKLTNDLLSVVGSNSQVLIELQNKRRDGCHCPAPPLTPPLFVVNADVCDLKLEIYDPRNVV